MTPFQILYGRSAPTILRYNKNSSGNTLVDNLLIERDQTIKLLKDNLRRAQARMKMFANRNRREVSLAVGDWAYVNLQPFRQNSIRLQRHNKLGRRFFGPYKVVSDIGEVAPAAILDICHIQRSTQLAEQWLVHWDGLSTFESTWEDKAQLLRMFPTLKLEDKLLLHGGGNGMNPPGMNPPKAMGDTGPSNNMAVRNGNRIQITGLCQEITGWSSH